MSTLTKNIEAYWKLDELEGKVIDELGKFHLTNYGASQGQTGKINYGYSFSGHTPGGLFARGGTLQGFNYVVAPSFSVSMWIKRNASTERQVLWTHGQYSNTLRPQLYLDANVLKYQVGSSTATISGTISTGVWHHIVLTVDIDGSLKCYVDNVQTGSTTFFLYTIQGYIGIGGLLWSGSQFNEFNGSIDEVGFWSRALGAVEVDELYNGGSGLTYPFEPNDSITLNYGLKYYCDHYVSADTYQTKFTIEIHELDYTGAAAEIRAGKDVFNHVYEEIDPETIFENPIQKSRFEFYPLIQNDIERQLLEDIFLADEITYKLIKKVNGVIEWTGYVIPGLLEYEEKRYPILGTIIAKDLSFLESVYYPLKAVDDYSHTVIDEVCEMLGVLNFGLNVRVFTDWTSDDLDPHDDLLNQLRHNTYHLRVYGETVDQDEALTYFQALGYMLKPYNLLLRQQNNCWELININYLTRSEGQVTYYEYDYTGLQIGSTDVDLRTNLDNVDKFLFPSTLNRFIIATKTIDFEYHHKSSLKGIRFPAKVYQYENTTLEAGSMEFDIQDNNGFYYSVFVYLDCPWDNQNVSTKCYFYLRTDNYSWNHQSQQWEFGQFPSYVPVYPMIGAGPAGVGVFGGWVLGQTDPVPHGSEGKIRMVLNWCDSPVDGNDVTEIRWQLAVNAVTDAPPENLYSLYRITQNKSVSKTKNLGSTIFGAGPSNQSRSAIGLNPLGDNSVVIGGSLFVIDDNFKIIGEELEYNITILALKEAMDVLRNPLHYMDLVARGYYSPHNVINYFNKLYFMLSGTQIGSNITWQSSCFLEMSINESTTDVIQQLSREEVEAGGSGGNSGGSPGSGSGGTGVGGGSEGNGSVLINLNLKADKDGGDSQMFFYPEVIDSASLFIDLLSNEKLLLKSALDRIAELITELIETKVDEDGGDAFMLYYPEDNDNSTGFFAGLLTGGAATIRDALDRIVSVVQDFANSAFGGSFWSGFQLSFNDHNTYNLTPIATSGNHAPTGLFLVQKPELLPVMFVDGVLCDYGYTEDWFFGEEDSTGTIINIPFASLVGGEQIYWNGTINAARSKTIVYGDLQAYNRVSFLHAVVEVEISSSVVASSVPASSAPSSVPSSVPDSTSPLVTNLVSFWKLDEASDALVLVDIFGNNDADVLSDSSELSSEVGKLGTAIGFDGNAYADVPYDSGSDDLNPTDAITIQAWVMITGDTGDGQHFISKIRQDGTHVSPYFSWSLQCIRVNATTFTPRFWVGTSAGANSRQGGNVSINTWFHFVGRYNSATGELAIFLNGTKSSGTISGTLNQYTTPVRFGMNGNLTEPLIGRLDDVAVWHEALTDAQIAQLYNSGNGLPYPLW